MTIRSFWVIVHRSAGLTLALFLTVAGLTGSLLAFNAELDALAAPALHYVAPPGAGSAMLDPLVLRDRVMARHPGGVIDYLPLHNGPGRSSHGRTNGTNCSSTPMTAIFWAIGNGVRSGKAW